MSNANSDAEYPKLARQPLSLTLAEVRFSKVLKMEDYIADLQELLRREYPEYRSQRTHSFNIGPREVSVDEQRPSWMFRDRGRRKAILVSHGGLVYFTSDYQRFPQFREECRRAIDAVKEVVDPGELERIGLRYNDVISPEPDRALGEYIDRSLAPPHFGSYALNMQHHRTESVVKTEAGYLAVRSVVGYLTGPVMPDLQAMIPISPSAKVRQDAVSAILDFDHIWQPDQPKDFDAGVAVERLEALHADARQAFFELTSKWAQEEVWS